MKPTVLHAKGATLLECLIALVIFSSALLGLIGAMLQCMRIERESTHMLQALGLMSAYNEKLRLQHSSSRSSDKLLIENLFCVEDLSKKLPNGSAKLTFYNSKATILITWQGNNQPYQLVSTVSMLY